MSSSSEHRGVGVVEMFVTGLSSATYKTLIAPIDRVRLVVQLQSELTRHGRSMVFLKEPDVMTRHRVSASSTVRSVWRVRNALVPKSAQFAFNGSGLATTVHIAESEGVKGFFRGNGISVATAFCSGPLQLYAVSPLHRFVIASVFLTPDPSVNPLTFILAHTLAALISGAVSSAIVYPLDVARVALAGDVRSNGTFEHANFRQLMQRVARHEFDNTSGLRAHELGLTKAAPYACLYRGLALGFAGQVLYRTTFWGLYETTGYMRGSDKFSATQEFFASYAMTGFATLLLYPLDTVRRCYMRAGVSVHAATLEREMATRSVATGADAALHVNPDLGAGIAYRNVGECVSRIWASEGPVGFFRGAALLPVRSLVMTGLAFSLPRLLGQWTLA